MTAAAEADPDNTPVTEAELDRIAAAIGASRGNAGRRMRMTRSLKACLGFGIDLRAGGAF